MRLRFYGCCCLSLSVCADDVIQSRLIGRPSQNGKDDVSMNQGSASWMEGGRTVAVAATATQMTIEVGSLVGREHNINNKAAATADRKRRTIIKKSLHFRINE